MQPHTSREIAQAMVDRAFAQVRRDREYNRVLNFALSHLPGSTKVPPVRCRLCNNTGLAKRGSCFVPCSEDHTEDGVECSMCYADATEYVWIIDGGEAHQLPMCDHHKAKAVKAGDVLVQIPAVPR